VSVTACCDCDCDCDCVCWRCVGLPRWGRHNDGGSPGEFLKEAKPFVKDGCHPQVIARLPPRGPGSMWSAAPTLCL